MIDRQITIELTPLCWKLIPKKTYEYSHLPKETYPKALKKITIIYRWLFVIFTITKYEKQ